MLTSTSCGIKDENSPPTSRSFVPIYGYTDTFAWDECARVILHTMHNEWSSRCKNLVSHLARRTKCCEQRGPCWVILLFFYFLFFFLFVCFIFVSYIISIYQFPILYIRRWFYRLARFKENILSNFVEYKKKKIRWFKTNLNSYFAFTRTTCIVYFAKQIAGHLSTRVPTLSPRICFLVLFHDARKSLMRPFHPLQIIL